MTDREKAYIAEQVNIALAGAWKIRGATRWFIKRNGKKIGEHWAFKSTGRTGAAVRFYMQERLRARVSIIGAAASDRQTPREGAPRGSRRGKPQSPRTPFRLLPSPTYRAPTRAERATAHAAKMARKYRSAS